MLDASDVKEKLSLDFDIVKLVEENGKAKGFNVKVKNEDSPVDEYYIQDSGKYWAYTYDYSTEHFGKFLKRVARVAELLNLAIDDPQLGEENLAPNKFLEKRRIKTASITQNVLDKLHIR